MLIEKRKYILAILIGLTACFYLTYKSYMFNVYMVEAKETHVIVDNVNCYVRSGKSGSRSEVYFFYLDRRYTSLVSKENCDDLDVGDVITLFYAKEIDEFSYKAEANKPRLYIFGSFIIILMFLLFKIIFR